MFLEQLLWRFHREEQQFARSPHGSLGSNLLVDLCVDGMTSNKEAMVAETLDKVWDMLLLKFPKHMSAPMAWEEESQPEIRTSKL